MPTLKHRIEKTRPLEGVVLAAVLVLSLLIQLLILGECEIALSKGCYSPIRKVVPVSQRLAGKLNLATVFNSLSWILSIVRINLVNEYPSSGQFASLL